MKIYLILITLILSPSQNIFAIPQTDTDFMLLPPYCHARLRGTPSEIKKWQRRFGRSFIHLHHYCEGLDFKNKVVSAVNEEIRQSHRVRAIQQFQYMIKNASNFPLMHENYYFMGQMYQGLGKKDLALKAFKNSIKENKKYARAYGALSDCYIDRNDLDEASTILNQGLEHSPDSKGLNRRLQDISK